jgi:hypothetical protein
MCACFPHLGVPMCISPNYSHTLMCMKHFISHTLGGTPSQNPPVRPSIQALPKKETLTTMQEDMTTNLTLTDPESAGLTSRNLQISPQTSRQSTTIAGTNEVALWALQLYIVHFSKLPYSILEAVSVRFPICLHPRDQDPTTYTVTFPGPPYLLGPRGSFFSHHAKVQMLMFKILK